MKNLIRHGVVSLLFGLASAAFGAAPPMSVTVSDSSGHAAYKGATDASGVFSTAPLRPGHYVVQFNARSRGVTGNNYALIVSAGRKKVVADSVAGEKFTGGGVAMRIEVGDGSKITGQITDALMTMVDKDGRRLVWIGQKLGSHLPGHWAEQDSPEAKEALTFTTMSRQDLQNRQNQGVGLR